MKRLVLAATVFAAFAFLSGCAAARPVAKTKEPPPLSVRIPVVDASTMNIESDPSIAYPIANPELPLSLADESRGRWLNIFEVNYSAPKPIVPPLPDIEEEP
jgi:hypothetical protein